MARTSIKTLVQGFSQSFRELKSPDYRESQVRLHYVDPFWELLGWDVSNEKQKPPQDLEVVVEPSLDSPEDDKLRSRKPDYLFRIHGFSRFVVEAKKPAVDLDTDRRSIFQAKRYAWNAAIPFAILMDFEQFRLYDTTLKPLLNDPNRGLVTDYCFDFQDYPNKWEEIEAVFGREAVANGSLERLRAKIRRVPAGRRLRTVDRMLFDLKGDEPVDRVFLEYLQRYRQQLAREVYNENKAEFPEADTLHGAARLTEAVQRLIDRLVFMRVCEDRGISRWGNLRDILERASAEREDYYRSLCLEFRDLDREFNGYLFKHHFSETLNVPGDVLADFTRTLYPPEAPWDFSAISDDILGIVYERFLGNIVTVKNRLANVEEKPEVRHAGGVYYTPRFVVDTIIRRVIGPQIKGRTPAQVLDLKILDPACGSGSFLVAAFQYLIDHCLQAIAADPALATVPATPRARKKRKEIAFQDAKQRWHLAPDFKAELLTRCIHGVDIDQQAVEVTVMSLYLKMLQGAMPPSWQKDWVENELLPPLENNILCGNSLIDSIDFSRYCEDKLGGLFPVDEDVQFRMNRFDWTSRTRGFGRLIDSQSARERGRSGFDCIIGNPPYVRVQELNKWAPEECEFYKWRYQSAAKGNYDIYVVFVERGLSLLAPTGLLGFIMPHKFWQSMYGEGLRNVIADGRNLRSIVDFTHEIVFRDASIYTAIHILSKSRDVASRISIARVEKLIDGPAQMLELDTSDSTTGTQVYQIPHPPSGAPWSLIPPAREGLLQQVRGATDLTLGKLAIRMAQGIRTSLNDVYVLSKVSPRGNLYRSAHLGKTVELEAGLLHPFLGAEQIRRYEVLSTDKVVLIPYQCSDKKNGDLIDIKLLRQNYPATWKYLKDCETALRGRERGKMDGPGWYGFIYPKNLALIGTPKILVPDIIAAPSFSLDLRGELAFVSGYAITLPRPTPIQLMFLLGLLNSSLLGTYLKDISTPLRGGWHRPFPQFLSRLPIKLPDTTNERKLAARIVHSVRAIMEAKIKVRNPKLSDRDRRTLEGEVDSHERLVDETVLQLYGIDKLPDS